MFRAFQSGFVRRGKWCLAVAVLPFAVLGTSGCTTLSKADSSRSDVTDWQAGGETSSTRRPAVNADTRASSLEPVQPGRDDALGADLSTSAVFAVPELASEQAQITDPVNTTPPAKPAVGTVDAVVPPLALPLFIDAVFGEMLQLPYLTGEGVAARTEVVQLRSSGEMSGDDFFALVQNLLDEYGIRVVWENGVYKVLEGDALRDRIPLFLRSRNTSLVPTQMRPLVMFVELEAMTPGGMVDILNQAFPDKDRLTLRPNPAFNMLTLIGLKEDVDAALAIIDAMDELTYAGTQVLRYTPRYWDARALSDELLRIMQSEGWPIANVPSVQRTILVLPVEFSNNLFVFARTDRARERARFWLSELDQPQRTGDIPRLFVYRVENVDATLLADTIGALIEGAATLGAGNTPEGAPNAGDRTQRAKAGSALVVDPMSNQLIFSATASEYDRLLPLLRQLDRPPGEVLIEVTVAEVTLSDETDYGLEFFIDSIGNADVQATLNQGGLGLGSGGLDISVLSGNVGAAINAFTRNSRVRVLSRPRLVARSGGAAQIQVGTDVPVVSSQRAAGAQDGDGGIDVLQSVEYRKTGVLLNIEPIVFSHSRVDLNIQQEVSTAIPTTTSAISSPTISNRNLQTQLSLADGETVVIGGLIQSEQDLGETGIPLLKDLPVVGNLFKASSMGESRSELLVLITCYILRDRNDKRFFTQQFLDELDREENNAAFMTLTRDSLHELKLPQLPTSEAGS